MRNLIGKFKIGEKYNIKLDSGMKGWTYLGDTGRCIRVCKTITLRSGDYFSETLIPKKYILEVKQQNI